MHAFQLKDLLQAVGPMSDMPELVENSGDSGPVGAERHRS